MITYGFFNSVDSDRLYNADQMSEYFKGIVSNGVFRNVGGKLQVTASGGMNVNVQTGRAIIDCKWLKNSSIYTVPVNPSHITLARYTAVIVKLDTTNRLMEITTKDGEPASFPTYPSISANELCLAMIYINANSTNITQANIQDTRGNRTLCGWVTNVVDYESLTTEFDTWFQALTDQLNINTFIQSFRKDYSMVLDADNYIMLDMAGYSYEPDDIIYVYINGLLGVPGVDYTIDTTTLPTPFVITVVNKAGNDVTIIVLKSRIGSYTLVTNNGHYIVTDDDDTITTS